ncbi:type VII secretion system-associated protein [Streptomyces tubbatahanensis]|uniref:Type VII secretion system-associated protein n=1 Tax=Streptomyces tubbatahanensis TaxID=2923272 RepID=A0ABY3XYU1_9ACTN|nr:type VII secretion system-associated protein [Streptomyces tubbatahanensis]UNS99671.1 type VII secretion system-associated protein [Streptomyces tubbatahanensis]
MAEGNQPPTQLNKEWLQNFKDHDIAAFRDALKAVSGDSTGDPVIPGMLSLKGDNGAIDGLPYGTPVPLAIGNLAQDQDSNGDRVNSAVVEMVNALEGILTSHKELFKDIDSALEETIETLLKTQGESLDSIEGQKLFDIFEDEDVETDLTTTPNEDDSGGGGGEDDEDE